MMCIVCFILIYYFKYTCITKKQIHNSYIFLLWIRVFPKVLTVDQDTELHSLVLGVPLSLGIPPTTSWRISSTTRLWWGSPTAVIWRTPSSFSTEYVWWARIWRCPSPAAPSQQCPRVSPARGIRGTCCGPAWIWPPAVTTTKLCESTTSALLSVCDKYIYTSFVCIHGNILFYCHNYLLSF